MGTFTGAPIWKQLCFASWQWYRFISSYVCTTTLHERYLLLLLPLYVCISFQYIFQKVSVSYTFQLSHILVFWLIVIEFMWRFFQYIFTSLTIPTYLLIHLLSRHLIEVSKRFSKYPLRLWPFQIFQVSFSHNRIMNSMKNELKNQYH